MLYILGVIYNITCIKILLNKILFYSRICVWQNTHNGVYNTLTLLIGGVHGIFKWRLILDLTLKTDSSLSLLKEYMIDTKLQTVRTRNFTITS